MTRLSIFKTLFPLFFFLLSLSACHKPSIPTKKVAAAPTSSGTPATPVTPTASGTPATSETPTSSGTPATPVTPTASNPRPWEQLPRINLDWIKPDISATVTNTEGDTTEVNFYPDTIKEGKPLVFKPDTGNYVSINTRFDNNIMRFSIKFSPDIDKSTGNFQSHTYFNGKYINLSEDYPYQSRVEYITIHPSTSYTLKPTDTWYFIFVFRGTDGKYYQYRTPDMSIANAS